MSREIPFPHEISEVTKNLTSHGKDYTCIKTQMIDNLNSAMQIVTCWRTEGISLERILNSIFLTLIVLILLVGENSFKTYEKWENFAPKKIKQWYLKISEKIFYKPGHLQKY